MKNLKQYIPILVFVVTLVLSGVTILTSKELEKRKYIPPPSSLANEGICSSLPCAAGDVPYQGDANGNPVASGGQTWYTSPAQSPDPSTRPSHEQCVSTGVTCSACSKSCGGGTQTCSDNCGSSTQSCNPQSCTSTPTPTPTITITSTPTITPTSTITSTPTITPTGTLTPTPTITTSPTPTPTGVTYSHNVCVDKACVSQLCNPANQQCSSTCSGEVDCNSRLTCVNLKCVRVIGSGSDDCQSDVGCQPQAVTPKVPTSGTSTPTILSIIGGSALLLGGILLAL